MSIVQVILVCSFPKVKTLSKPEPVQTGIKVCPQGIPVLTGFTVFEILKSRNYIFEIIKLYFYHMYVVILFTQPIHVLI